MAKSTNNKIYLKLGDKATSFTDPRAGIALAKGEVVEIEAVVFGVSKFAKDAKHSGHIVEVDKAEYDAFLKKSKAPTGKVAPAKASAAQDDEDEEEDDDDEEEDEEEDDDDEEEDEKELPKKPGPAATGKAGGK